LTDLQAALRSALADRYRIERGLGAGGMATVYLAHDIRHDRRVALKVLRPELSAILGAERFLTEIKTTANLQHPHILGLFDSGEAEGFVYYVMPYVDGESLRDRITREKQLPIDEALRIAREVADALEYAHQHGIVHRDIKPENILLHGGHAVVADFGIALAASRSEGGTRMTETGMSLGTPHYMSPEQAMGDREITPRADIYALGCVVYEMLTGEPPFVGASAQAVIGRVLTEEPRSLTAQRKTIPPHVDDAVRVALSKLPADRFASAKEFNEALAKPGFSAGAIEATKAITAARSARSRRDIALMTAPWMIAVATLGLFASNRPRPGTTPTAPVTRFSMPLTPGPETGYNWHPMAMSPDGSRIVYVAMPASGQQLFLRRFDALNPVPIAGTSGAVSPFFSHDGSQLAFVNGNRLMKVAADGGTAIPIATVGNQFLGGTWSEQDTILFADERGLVVVPASGGELRIVVPRQDGASESLRWPEFLPGGRAAVLSVFDAGIDRLAVFTMQNRAVRRFETVGANPHYVRQGFVVVAQFPPGGPTNVVSSGALLAVPFDVDRLELAGAAVPVVENVQVGPISRTSKAAVSRSGTVVIAPGSVGLTSLVAVGRNGVAADVGVPFRFFSAVRVSPNERYLALAALEAASGTDIWLFDRVARGGLTRLTFDGSASRPLWTPDGRHVVYQRAGNAQDVAWIAADGSTPAESLVVADDDQVPAAITPDGRTLVLREGGVLNKRRISMVSLDSSRVPRSIINTPYDNHSPSLSPDGKWIAYVSNETNLNQVYVRPFPGPGGKWQLSTDGGVEPLWSRTGREIFFRNGDKMIAVPVTTGATFTHGEPRELFSFRAIQGGVNHPSYDATADGQTFFMIRAATPIDQSGMIVLLHWFDEQASTR
jgi:serine/threonine-protein kinase